MAILSLLSGGNDPSACSDLRPGANKLCKQSGAQCATKQCAIKESGLHRETECCLNRKACSALRVQSFDVRDPRFQTVCSRILESRPKQFCRVGWACV